MGRKLPAQIKIFIHEEDPNTLHFSIPPAPSNLTELSDQDLDKVVGGTDIVASVVAVISIAVTSGGVARGIGAGVTHNQGW